MARTPITLLEVRGDRIARQAAGRSRQVGLNLQGENDRAAIVEALTALALTIERDDLGGHEPQDVVQLAFDVANELARTIQD